MNGFFQHRLEPDNRSIRESIYGGTVYLLSANDESRQFVANAWRALHDEFGSIDPRDAQFHFDSDEFFVRMGRLRKLLYTSDRFHQHVCAVMGSVGFDPVDHAFDPARLRTVAHEGHLNPAAQAVYYGHRDTWYANPQSMVTWWIPLHEVRAEETFEFFPDDFARAVANDSEVFDFDAWVVGGQEKRIGWQNRLTGATARYPRLCEPPRGRRVSVACSAADILLFSGQHLHQTRENVTGRTRFSLDFRTVHLTDHESGVAAINVDNRSTGTSLNQFVRGVDYPAGA